MLNKKCKKMREVLLEKKKHVPDGNEQPVDSALLQQLSKQVEEAGKTLNLEEKRYDIEEERNEREVRDREHRIKLLELQIKEKDQEIRLYSLRAKELRKSVRYGTLKPIKSVGAMPTAKQESDPR